MNFNTYIYIPYYKSILLNYLPPNPASYPYEMESCICNGDVGTAMECVHNLGTISDYVTPVFDLGLISITSLGTRASTKVKSHVNFNKSRKV